MPRMRSLKPEYWLDRKLARLLSRDERMLYVGLWNQADEWGRANGDPRVVKGQVFPFDDELTDAVIGTMLKSLEAAGVVQQYEHEGDPFLFLPNLAKHQRLEPHKVPSRFPEPPPNDPDQQEISLSDQQVHAPPAHDPGAAQTSPGAGPGRARAKHVAGGREHVDTSGCGPDPSAPTFADFYAAYPRREARRKAEQAWASAIKRASPQAILDGLRRFRFNPDRRYVPMPATWLNQDRWADNQPLPGTAPPGAGEPRPAGQLSRQHVDEVLGPDSWQPPAPPPELDPETDWAGFAAWQQRAVAEHHAERERAALARLGGTL